MTTAPWQRLALLMFFLFFFSFCKLFDPWPERLPGYSLVTAWQLSGGVRGHQAVASQFPKQRMATVLPQLMVDRGLLIVYYNNLFLRCAQYFGVFGRNYITRFDPFSVFCTVMPDECTR